MDDNWRYPYDSRNLQGNEVVFNESGLKVTSAICGTQSILGVVLDKACFWRVDDFIALFFNIF